MHVAQIIGLQNNETKNLSPSGPGFPTFFFFFISE